jgi:hypothetical protein
MKKLLKLISIPILLHICDAHADTSVGVCAIDKELVGPLSIENLLGARSRAQTDFIPIFFNSKNLYIGLSEDNSIKFEVVEYKKAGKLMVAENKIENTSVSLVWQTDLPKKPIIIYSNGLANYIGPCELR